MSVTGSGVAAKGEALLQGKAVTLDAALGSRDVALSERSSSTGLTARFYENLSGAAQSVAGLPGRIGSGASGGAAQVGVTTASEVLRSVRAVMTAVQDAAGVSVSLGSSRTQNTTRTHEETATGAAVTGDRVAIRALSGDVTVTGSQVRAVRGASLSATGDVVLRSAQENANGTTRSRTTGLSLGASLGVGLAGGVTGGVSLGATASGSDGSSRSVRQVETVVDGGGTLSIASGRDVTLSGARATGRDVTVSAAGDLRVESVADTASHGTGSYGGSVGLSLGSGGGKSSLGGNAGVTGSSDTGNASRVGSQSGIEAQGGVLDATVGGTTRLVGGLLAARDASGGDSGSLRLTTGRLEASDVAERAHSLSMSAGLSSSINAPSRGGEAAKGNMPTVQGGYASSDFAGLTKATIGSGTVTVRDALAGEALSGVNRDVSQSRVVTRDEHSGMTVYVDPGAIKEASALVQGKTEQSVILTAVDKLASDPLAMAKAVAAEIASFSDGVRKSGTVETLLDRMDSLVPGFTARQKSQIVADARASMIGHGISAEVADAAIAHMEDAGVFDNAAKLNKAITLNGNELVKHSDKAIQAVKDHVARGDTLPQVQSSQTQSAQADPVQQVDESNTATANITVTGRRLSKEGGIADLAVTVSEKTGGAFNNAPEWMQSAIGYGSMALGGVSGVVKATLGELTGVSEMLDKGKEVLTVGADALLRADTFGQVYGENQDKTGANPTFNQTTGVDLIGSTVLSAVVGGISAKGGAKNSTAEDVNLASPSRTKHILYGDETGGGHLWPGGSGKSSFPKDWTSSKIMKEVSDIATDPNIIGRVQANGRIVKEAVRDGINIRVILEPKSKGGEIVTAFPTSIPRNPK